MRAHCPYTRARQQPAAASREWDAWSHFRDYCCELVNGAVLEQNTDICGICLIALWYRAEWSSAEHVLETKYDILGYIGILYTFNFFRTLFLDKNKTILYAQTNAVYFYAFRLTYVHMYFTFPLTSYITLNTFYFFICTEDLTSASNSNKKQSVCPNCTGRRDKHDIYKLLLIKYTVPATSSTTLFLCKGISIGLRLKYKTTVTTNTNYW